MKRFLGKLAVLGFTVMLLQVLLSLIWLMPSMERDFTRLVQLKKYIAEGRDVIFFGDSTNDFSPAGEADRRSISTMVSDNIAPLRLGTVAHPAYHADLFKEFCRFMSRQEQVPSVVIIPINMRSFAPNWHNKPSFQFGMERVILRRGFLFWFYRPLAVFKFNFNRINERQYLKIPVYLVQKQVGVIKDFRIRRKREFPSKQKWREYANQAVADVLLVHYMYGLSSEHPKILSLKKIAAHLSKRQIKPIFYITPVDYMTGEHFYPNQFSRNIMQNIQSVKQILAEMRATVIDCSRDLKAVNFAWRRPVVNEHLTWQGRKHVADRLTKEIKCFLK